MQDTEHQLQKAITQYLNLLGLCWFAIPNGGRRNIITATRLKSEGLKSGIPDICIISTRAYFIEVKKPKTSTPAGKLSLNQKERIAQIERSGGIVGIAYSVGDVEKLLKLWGI